MFLRCTLVCALCANFTLAYAQPLAGNGANRTTETPNKSALDVPFLENTLDGLSKLGAFTSGSAGSAAETDTITEPYIWVRMSKNYLANHVEREVDREKPAQDRILGITFVGTSRTTGTTRLVLHPSERVARGHVLFEGKIRSRTTGRKGPATLHYLSNSTFRAHKQLAITESGLKTWPATARAPTRLTPTRITTSLPGLRGRIVHRIAWRRAALSQAQADAIASDHRARDIREALNRRLDDAVASIETRIHSELADLQLALNNDQLTMRSRSTPDYIEVALLPPRLDPDQFKMPDFQVDADAGLAIRVHRLVIARVMTNLRLYDKLAALSTSLMLGPTGNAGREQQLLAMDSQWLSFDVSAPVTVKSDVRIGAATDEQQRLR